MLSYTPKIPSFVLYIKSVYCNHITQTVCNGHNEQLTTTHHLIRSEYSTRFLYILLVFCIFYSFPVYSPRFLYILLVSRIFYSFPVYSTRFLYILLVSYILYLFPVYYTRFLYIILVSWTFWLLKTSPSLISVHSESSSLHSRLFNLSSRLHRWRMPIFFSSSPPYLIIMNIYIFFTEQFERFQHS